MLDGMAGVSGLPTRDFKTDKLCRPFGVTEHKQHTINSSAGSKAYKLMHIFCAVPTGMALGAASLVAVSCGAASRAEPDMFSRSSDFSANNLYCGGDGFG